MGEASRRGTFEQRKTESILRNKIELRARTIERAKIEAAKTPEQRAKERRAKIATSMAAARLLGMFGGGFSSWDDLK